MNDRYDPPDGEGDLPEGIRMEVRMKTQNWIDGTAFVSGLAIAAVIWTGVHGADGGGFGWDKQLIQAANVTVSNTGQAGSQRESGQSGGTSSQSGQAHDWTDAIEVAPHPYRPITSLSKSSLGDYSTVTRSPPNSSNQSNPKSDGSQPDSTTAPANHNDQPDSTIAPANRNDQPDSTTALANRNDQPDSTIAPANHNDQPDSTTEPINRNDQPDSTTTPANRNVQSHQAAPPTKHPDRSSGFTPSAEAPKLSVRVYLADTKRVERVPLEQYVRGVLAAEMPTDFEPAALQAQALAARTYIVRRLLHEDRSGVPTEKADVTDTQTHQVYRSKAEMDKLRKSDDKAWQAIDEAVSGTQGLVIAYDGEPIDALYFSSSNGYTENSEDVFGFALPYLRSVDSPWDRDNAPRSIESVTLPLDQFYDKLGILDLPTTGQQEKSTPAIAVQSRTTGKRIRTLAVDDTKLTGVQVRDKLGLRSADFSWQISKEAITITTRGSGHGVGMSQWGAQGMALAGYTADEIVSHYYSGAELVKVSQFL